MTDDEKWTKYSFYVLKQIETLVASDEDHEKRFNKINEDLVQLKIKAGVWGLLGGAIPVLIGIGVFFLRTLIK